jgi:hypothetical protein
MFSSQACSGLHSHQKLSPCRWSASGPSLTGVRGSTVLGKKYSSLINSYSSYNLDAPLQNPVELFSYKKAHPKRHLLCAIISSLLFFVTG